MRRLFPAVALLLLSPVVAEFLLGDFTVRQLGAASLTLAGMLAVEAAMVAVIAIGTRRLQRVNEIARVS